MIKKNSLLFLALKASISWIISSILLSSSILWVSSSSILFSSLLASTKFRAAFLSASRARSDSRRASSSAFSSLDFSARNFSCCSRNLTASSRDLEHSTSTAWSLIAQFSSWSSFSRSRRDAHSRCLRCSICKLKNLISFSLHDKIIFTYEIEYSNSVVIIVCSKSMFVDKIVIDLRIE